MQPALVWRCNAAYSELECEGFRHAVPALLNRFRLREGCKPKAAE
jgi:hypothetical protein